MRKQRCEHEEKQKRLMNTGGCRKKESAQKGSPINNIKAGGRKPEFTLKRSTAALSFLMHETKRSHTSRGKYN